jgi:hypothetical protein
VRLSAKTVRRRHCEELQLWPIQLSSLLLRALGVVQLNIIFLIEESAMATSHVFTNN